jgi:hypothetical protein
MTHSEKQIGIEDYITEKTGIKNKFNAGVWL